MLYRGVVWGGVCVCVRVCCCCCGGGGGGDGGGGGGAAAAAVWFGIFIRRFCENKRTKRRRNHLLRRFVVNAA